MSKISEIFEDGLSDEPVRFPVSRLLSKNSTSPEGSDP